MSIGPINGAAANAILAANAARSANSSQIETSLITGAAGSPAASVAISALALAINQQQGASQLIASSIVTVPA